MGAFSNLYNQEGCILWLWETKGIFMMWGFGTEISGKKKKKDLVISILQLHHGYIDKVSELEACKTYTTIIMAKQLPFIKFPHILDKVSHTFQV